MKNNQLKEFIFYTTPTGGVKVDVLIQDETVWLTQKRLAELFGVTVSAVNQHLQNAYETNEIKDISTIKKILIVQNEGGREVAEYT